MATIISTQELCDKCDSAPAAVECETQHGRFVFCGHDFRAQMKVRAFQRILITSAPLRADS